MLSTAKWSHMLGILILDVGSGFDICFSMLTTIRDGDFSLGNLFQKQVGKRNIQDGCQFWAC